MRILLRSLLVFLALMAGMAAAVRAQSPAQVVRNCEGGIASPILFGTFESWQLYSSLNSREFDTSFRCDLFSGVNIGIPAELKVTAQSVNNGEMKLGAARLPYKLYTDASKSIHLAFGRVTDIPQSAFSLLGWGGGVSGGIKFILETQDRVTPVTGIYKDTISLTWSWAVCTGLGINLGVVRPCLGWNVGTAVTTVDVSIDVSKSCKFKGTAATLDFGSQPLVSMFEPSTAKLEIYCTLQTPYKLYVGDGDNSANGMRRMKGPGDNYIEYQLYQQGTKTVLSQTAPLNGTATGKDESITIDGRVNTQQADVPVGVYIDKPIVTIEY